MRMTRRRYLEKSTTSPGPSDSPATPLPAPRACNGNAFFGRVLHASGHIGGRSRTHHAQRPDFIDAAVAGEELAEEVVAPHVA